MLIINQHAAGVKVLFLRIPCCLLFYSVDIVKHTIADNRCCSAIEKTAGSMRRIPAYRQKTAFARRMALSVFMNLAMKFSMFFLSYPFSEALAI